MSSIGPQLPPDLTKRKRSPSVEPPSPPAKQARHTPVNNDEINLSDSDDDFGPAAPSTTSAGPTAMPPATVSKPKGPEIRPSSPPTSQAGPQPAPAPAAAPDPNPSQDSSSDDDYGPSLPNAHTKRPTIGPTLPAASPLPQRDTWMLAPPTKSSYSERDPTRMRNRKFASKPGPAPSDAGAPTIWTETPEEKLKRQRDALLGRTSGTAASTSSRDRQQEERDSKIAENIEAHRGRSLYDEHADKRREEGVRTGRHVEEEDDPSKRAFDREKDMAVGGQIGEKQRRELVNKSANFGGRFQKGSFL